MLLAVYYRVMEHAGSLESTPQEKIERFQTGLLLENILNKLSKVGIILENLIIF